jgi:hypothetical protein
VAPIYSYLSCKNVNAVRLYVRHLLFQRTALLKMEKFFNIYTPSIPMKLFRLVNRLLIETHSEAQIR